MSTSLNGITVLTNGIYRIDAQMPWAFNSNGTRFMVITVWRSNALLREVFASEVTPGTHQVNQWSGSEALAANDQVRMFVIQNSGGALNGGLNSPNTLRLTVTWERVNSA